MHEKLECNNDKDNNNELSEKIRQFQKVTKQAEN